MAALDKRNGRNPFTASEGGALGGDWYGLGGWPRVKALFGRRAYEGEPEPGAARPAEAASWIEDFDRDHLVDDDRDGRRNRLIIGFAKQGLWIGERRREPEVR